MAFDMKIKPVVKIDINKNDYRYCDNKCQFIDMLDECMLFGSLKANSNPNMKFFDELYRHRKCRAAEIVK